MPKTYSMEIKVDYILLRILPEEASSFNDINRDDNVSRRIRELFNEIGGLIVSMNVGKEEVKVTWKEDGQDPITGIIKLLEQKRYTEAILLLEFFKSSKPDDIDILYNLGMAYSDLGELNRALHNLRRLLKADPNHTHGRVAIGVALMRQGQDKQAASELQKAVKQDPDNPWAQRNLGGCLLRMGEPKKAIEYLERATVLNPDDDRAWLGLGQAYELTGDLEKADETYKRVLDIDEFGEAAEEAHKARSLIAEKSFRSVLPSMERMDAVMYCLGAMERFENMSPNEVQQIGFEVAMIGMNGIDINDPEPKYKLRILPGNFSGLHLLCLEYVSFKQFAQDMDIGFDLSKEYRSAQNLFERKKYSGGNRDVDGNQ